MVVVCEFVFSFVIIVKYIEWLGFMFLNMSDIMIMSVLLIIWIGFNFLKWIFRWFKKVLKLVYELYYFKVIWIVFVSL